MATKKKAKSTKATNEINSTEKKVKGMQDGYKKSKEYLASEKLQNSTIADIAKKYGFDFSRSYAARQAETAAKAQRNVYNAQGRDNDAANKVSMARISNNYDSVADTLDSGYFQKFLGTQQSQADRGLNAGIAASQNLQLSMSKQGELADLWKGRSTDEQEESLRYANTMKTISDALAQVEKEKAANTENLYQNLLTKGYDILNSDRTTANQRADSAWNRIQDVVGTTLDLSGKRIADIYNEQQRADAAAARAAAARASRYSSPGGNPGGYNGTPAKTSLTPSVKSYNNVIKNQQQTPVDRFVGAQNTMENWRQRSLSPTVSRIVGANSHSVASTPNLTAWDKYKMLGL
jgi:hypothetical protein